jgi:transcriptional regulator GlxA family with amidase domain
LLNRLLEVLPIEALRVGGIQNNAPSLLRGLTDARLAAALRRLHEDPARAWTVADLAKEAALSRSTFFERFSRAL